MKKLLVLLTTFTAMGIFADTLPSAVVTTDALDVKHYSATATTPSNAVSFVNSAPLDTYIPTVVFVKLGGSTTNTVAATISYKVGGVAYKVFTQNLTNGVGKVALGDLLPLRLGDSLELVTDSNQYPSTFTVVYISRNTRQR